VREVLWLKSIRWLNGEDDDGFGSLLFASSSFYALYKRALLFIFQKTLAFSFSKRPMSFHLPRNSCLFMSQETHAFSFSKRLMPFHFQKDSCLFIFHAFLFFKKPKQLLQ